MHHRGLLIWQIGGGWSWIVCGCGWGWDRGGQICCNASVSFCKLDSKDFFFCLLGFNSYSILKHGITWKNKIHSMRGQTSLERSAFSLPPRMIGFLCQEKLLAGLWHTLSHQQISARRNSKHGCCKHPALHYKFSIKRVTSRTKKKSPCSSVNHHLTWCDIGPCSF